MGRSTYPKQRESFIAAFLCTHSKQRGFLIGGFQDLIHRSSNSLVKKGIFTDSCSCRTWCIVHPYSQLYCMRKVRWEQNLCYRKSVAVCWSASVCLPVWQWVSESVSELVNEWASVCVSACVRACVRACVCECVFTFFVSSLKCKPSTSCSVQFSPLTDWVIWGHEERNSAGNIYKSLLQEALVSGSGMGRDVHSLMLYI